MRLYYVTIDGVRSGAPAGSYKAHMMALYSEAQNPANTGKAISTEEVESDCAAVDEGEGCLFCTS